MQAQPVIPSDVGGPAVVMGLEPSDTAVASPEVCMGQASTRPGDTQLVRLLSLGDPDSCYPSGHVGQAVDPHLVFPLLLPLNA